MSSLYAQISGGGGTWRHGGARCWSRAGSSPPPAAPTWTPSSPRTNGECLVRPTPCLPPPPPTSKMGVPAPQKNLYTSPRSAGAPGAAPQLGRPHRHLQTLRLRQERRRQDGLGGHAGGDPRAPHPPRDPGYVAGDGRHTRTAPPMSPGGDHPCGCRVPPTPGIEATTVYWPAKLRTSGRPVIFQLQFWDCGDGALKKFEHLLPVSQGGTGGTDSREGDTEDTLSSVWWSPLPPPASTLPRLVRRKRMPSFFSSPSPIAHPSRSCQPR